MRGVDLFFAAECKASGLAGLRPVCRPAGSRGPEEQQAEPARRQPMEPQPQARTLRDSDLGESTHTYATPTCRLRRLKAGRTSGERSRGDWPCLVPTLGSDPGVHQAPGSTA